MIAIFEVLCLRLVIPAIVIAVIMNRYGNTVRGAFLAALLIFLSQMFFSGVLDLVLLVFEEEE